jgi:hypothetical protein
LPWFCFDFTPNKNRPLLGGCEALFELRELFREAVLSVPVIEIVLAISLLG